MTGMQFSMMKWHTGDGRVSQWLSDLARSLESCDTLHEAQRLHLLTRQYVLELDRLFAPATQPVSLTY